MLALPAFAGLLAVAARAAGATVAQPGVGADAGLETPGGFRPVSEIG